MIQVSKFLAEKQWEACIWAGLISLRMMSLVNMMDQKNNRFFDKKRSKEGIPFLRVHDHVTGLFLNESK